MCVMLYSLVPSPTNSFSLLHTVLFIAILKAAARHVAVVRMFVDFAQVGYLESLMRSEASIILPYDI